MIPTPTPNLRLRPILERQSSAWAILNLFAETPNNEGAFRMRFDELSARERMFLVDFYALPSELRAFQRICVFWNVRLKCPETEN